MGFFIRKPFSFGPIRLNLSNWGLGASVGTKGARLGMRPNGTPYVYGGRRGLYYRQNLTASPRARSRAVLLILGTLGLVVFMVLFAPLLLLLLIPSAVISFLITVVATPKRTRGRPWG